MATYIPSEMRYNPVPFTESYIAKRTVTFTSPGTYNGGSSTTINFTVTSPEAFLDPTQSYFEFDLTPSTKFTAIAVSAQSHVITMDGHDGAFIKGCRTWIDGTTDIDKIDEYHKLVNGMYDLEGGDVMASSHAVAFGTPDAVTEPLTPFTAITGTQAVGTALKTLGCKRSTYAAAVAATTGTGTVIRACVRPLGFLQTSQYIPLFALGGAFNVEFTCENAQHVFNLFQAAGTAVAGGEFTGYTITNCRFHAVLLSFGPTVNNRYLNAIRSGRSLEIHYNTWLYTSDSMTSGTAKSVNAQIHAKSVKSMFMMMRDRRMATQPNAAANPYLSQRVVAGVNNVQLTIGDAVYPQTVMKISSTQYSRAFCELLKAMGRLGDVRAGSRIAPHNWVDGAETAATNGNYNAGAITLQKECLFFLGFDVEAFNSAASEGYICGVNTESQHSRMVFDCNIALGAITDLEFNVYGLCDGIVRIGANGSSVWV